MVYTLRFFFSSKCSLFHNSNLFGSSIIHILYTGCAKIKKNNSGAKRLITLEILLISWKSALVKVLSIQKQSLAQCQHLGLQQCSDPSANCLNALPKNINQKVVTHTQVHELDCRNNGREQIFLEPTDNP